MISALITFYLTPISSTQAILAGAAVNMETIPERLNPIVKPLMESIKRERCQILQQLTAQYLVKLLDLVRNRTPNPINKIVINLCHLLKSDLEFTPRIVSYTIYTRHMKYAVIRTQSTCSYSWYLLNFQQVPTEKSIGEFDSNDADTDKQNPYHGMLTLTIQSKGIMDNHGSSVPLRGRPPLADVALDDISEVEDPVK